MLKLVLITLMPVFLLSCETIGTDLNDAISSAKSSFETVNSSGIQNTNGTYPQIIQNKNFIRVFLYIHDHFLELVEEKIPERVKELILGMNDAGIKASLGDFRGIGTAFSVYKNSSAQVFVPLYDTAANAVRADMKQEQYNTMLNELRDISAKVL